MEVEEIQTQGHKFRRVGKGLQNKRGDDPSGDDDKDGDISRRSNGGAGTAAAVGSVDAGGGGGRIDFGAGGRLCGWPSSRIFRVSRASGGKDRHSKVWTSKGLRDRRVRLSVNTAIQFYDLQDRLGYDQPSKAVEWLLKAAASSIAELPPISTFPDTTNSNQLSDEKSLDSAPPTQMDFEMDPNCLPQQQQQQHQQGAMPKSACSSNSDNSKGSGLSLSRSERRVKARERARAKRVDKKDQDKDNESNLIFQQEQLGQSMTPPISQNAASFTELLTSGMNGNVNHNHHSHSDNTNSSNGAVGDASFYNKSNRGQYSSPMDYFCSGLLGPPSTRTPSHGFGGQLHLGNPLQQALAAAPSPLFTFTGDPFHHHHHPQELQQFSFLQDHFIPVLTAAAATGNSGSGNSNNNNNEYNLNFTISSSPSGLAGFSRGTLQSNSSTPSLLSHIPRIPPMDGSSPAFLIGAAAPNVAATIQPVGNHHHHHHHLLTAYDAIDSSLQLCYGDGGRQPDRKGKGKG